MSQTAPPSDTSAEAPPEPRHGVLRLSGFRMLLGSVAVGEFGMQISLLAMPLVAVLTLHASAFEVGLLVAAERAAFLLIGLPAGVWVDRMRRRSIMVTADVLRGALMLTIPVAAWFDVLTIWQLYGVAFVLGIATVFFDVASQSYLPFLVGREHLVEGNARLEAVRGFGQVAGPGAGGGLVQLVTAPTAILANAVTYFSSALFLAGVRSKEPKPSADGRRGLWAEMREGLGFVFRHTILRMIVACTAISNLFSSVALAVSIVFLVREVELAAGQVGVLMTAAPVGALAGALAASWLQRKVGSARIIWTVMVVVGPFGLLMPLAEPGWRAGLFAVGLFTTGFGAVVYNVGQVSFRQAVTPEPLLGRMNATVRFLVWGTMPLGGLLGGVLGQTAGLRPAMWIAVIGMLSACIPLLLSPLLRMRDVPFRAES
jgi:MFS family permease